MGLGVELYKYNYNELIDAIAEHVESDDFTLIKKVLLSCGEKIGDSYIIVRNDFWDEMDPYFTLFNLLDNIFNVSDTFSKIYKLKMEELISVVDFEKTLEILKEE